MFSQGKLGGDAGIEEQGQASPRETPSMVVRVEGQTRLSPLERTVQRVGTVITGTEAAWVVGWESR
jgi:hypothetical protein